MNNNMLSVALFGYLYIHTCTAYGGPHTCKHTATRHGEYTARTICKISTLLYMELMI